MDLENKEFNEVETNFSNCGGWGKGKEDVL